MSVLDAFAVIAYLCDEPAAEEVEALFEHPTTITSANLAEVIDQFVRVLGIELDDVLAETAMLGRFGLEVTPVDASIAIDAAILRAKHYHRSECAVSLADCIAAAVALRSRRPLVTADPHLAQLVRSEGGEVLAIPDSQGRRP